MPPKTDTNHQWRTHGSANHELYTQKRRKKDHATIRTRRNNKRHTGKMANKKIERTEIRLQKAAGQNYMQPIWDFQRSLRANTTSRNIAIEKTDGIE